MSFTSAGAAMTVRHLATASLSALLLNAGALTVRAQTSSGTSASESDARAYIVTTEQNDLLAIEEGRIAAQRATSAPMRAYGAKSAQAHAESTRMVEAAAKASGIAVPPPILTPAQRQLVQQLRSATTADFSTIFLEQHRDASKETIALQRAYASGGSNPGLRRVAGRLAAAAEGRVAQLEALEP